MKGFLKNYTQPPFLISLLLLVGFSFGMSYFKSHEGFVQVKKALFLKTSLDNLNEKLLGPYKVLRKMKIENKDEIESLGTEDYIQWLVEDTSADTLNSAKYCIIFITYYTGNPDQVPHVPEACYTGGGQEMKERASLDLDVGDIGLPGAERGGKIPATGLIFASKSVEVWQTSAQFPVIYFFKVNGQYKGNRTTTRLALGDLTSQYSYFSKVEMKFSGSGGQYPEMAQAAKAAEKLLKVLLPVLEKDHWPDWDKANKL